ncbi:MAG: aryl-sulfate sulfotransferase [Acidobacteriota bacterium]|nr:MAG: aryl-sulfate sulfotransferase [Acidobacteriota bacterium]
MARRVVTWCRGFGLLLVGLVGASLGCIGERPGEDGDRSRALSTPVAGAAEGYVLFSPVLSYTTYLIDKAGRVVHTWHSEGPPGVSPYLLDNGHLLRCAQQAGAPIHQGGAGGRVQELSWDGELLWDWAVSTENIQQHHDIEPLPNGNVLLIAGEHKSPQQAIEAGRDPELLGPEGLWPDCILEVKPEPPNGGRIVWEWHLWDHLIQEYDPERENYGKVSEHPELIDVNGPRPPELTDEVLQRLKAIGYLGAGARTGDQLADFTHMNSVAYNAELDQIALSVLYFNEIWIIDHSTTTEQAAGHAGGRCGKGGDLLYRWGHPAAYGRGGLNDQRLFGQHDARWIPREYPGAGNILVFNNGAKRLARGYSSIVEIEPPLDADGRYPIEATGRFGPAEPVWEYTAAEKESFFADFISGAHRLPNGNTFICSGPDGRFFEVSPNGETVWEYQNPYSGEAPNPSGDPPYCVFRATHLPPDHPALVGRDLVPVEP